VLSALCPSGPAAKVMPEIVEVGLQFGASRSLERLFLQGPPFSRTRVALHEDDRPFRRSPLGPIDMGRPVSRSRCSLSLAAVRVSAYGLVAEDSTTRAGLAVAEEKP
jgi:hypothetical protein